MAVLCDDWDIYIVRFVSNFKGKEEDTKFGRTARKSAGDTQKIQRIGTSQGQ